MHVVPDCLTYSTWIIGWFGMQYGIGNVKLQLQKKGHAKARFFRAESLTDLQRDWHALSHVSCSYCLFLLTFLVVVFLALEDFLSFCNVRLMSKEQGSNFPNHVRLKLILIVG